VRVGGSHQEIKLLHKIVMGKLRTADEALQVPGCVCVCVCMCVCVCIYTYIYVPYMHAHVFMIHAHIYVKFVHTSM
jgi:hypothetical protein